MSVRFDVIVIGVGSMGAATCWQLARRGARVLGLERFDIPHAIGAHHGQSRIIRKAYFEHPDYVPLLQKAYENWAALEAESGQHVLHRTGGIYMGPADMEVLAGSLAAARTYGLPHEPLSHAETRERFPLFDIPEHFVGMWDPDMGFVVPELAVAAFAEQAMRQGATLHGREPVTRWSADGEGVAVETARERYFADRLVLTAGAWTMPLLRDAGVPFDLSVTRQVMGWVWPRRPELFEYGRLPCWVIQEQPGGLHYGFPMMPDRPGFKIALHKPADPADPETVDRDPRPSDEATFRDALRRYIPEADGPLLSLGVCLYTNTADGHFILDRHPRHERVILGCGFSGHGFKFASVIGEALADLAMAGQSDLPIDFLGLARFR